MGYNLPDYDTDKLSFGPGILKIAPINAAGDTTSALVDVGAVRSGATLVIARTKLPVKQGSPMKLIKEYVTEETTTLTVAGLEWNIPNLARILGAGEVTGTTDLKLGGDMNMSAVAVEFTHRTPVGDTIIFRMWKGQGSGELSLTFGDDMHEIPYSFVSVEGTSDWDGNALADREKLIQIEVVEA